MNGVGGLRGKAQILPKRHGRSKRGLSAETERKGRIRSTLEEGKKSR